MALYKRKKWYWTDVTVNGIRYREPLETRDWRKAQTLERERVTQLKERAPDPEKRSKNYGNLSIEDAMKAYVAERRAQVSKRMVAYWNDQSKPLVLHFKTLPLKKIAPGHIADYQNARLDAKRAPKTITGEISVLRQLLKHARLWYRLAQDYKPVPNTRPPIGRALTPEEQRRLFETAAMWKPGSAPIKKLGKDGKLYTNRTDWQYAHAAAVLGAYCGMRECEIKGLQWKDVDFGASLLDIRRSKTPGGWRTPTNDADSGLAGYWALDSYTKHVQVWDMGDGTFCVRVKYNGSFVTVAGISPGNTGTVAAGVTGTMEGGYTGILTGSFTPGTNRTKGNIGSKDYACTITSGAATGCHYYSWVDEYFPGATLTTSFWGWTYNAGDNGTWVNVNRQLWRYHRQLMNGNELLRRKGSSQRRAFLAIQTKFCLNLSTTANEA